MTERDVLPIAPPPIADLVYVNLRRGRDAARTFGELAESMQVTRRVIEQSVQELRLRGFPIATGQSGCWLADRSGDLDETIDSGQSRLVSQYRTVRALRATRARMRAVEARGEAEQLWLPLGEAA